MQARLLRLSDYMVEGETIKSWMSDIVLASSGEFTEADLQAVIERGSHQAWAWCDDEGHLRGMFITTVSSYGGNPCLSVVGAAGSTQQEWEQASKILLDIAKQADCADIEIRGREGFAKQFRKMGWEVKYITLGRAV